MDAMRTCFLETPLSVMGMLSDTLLGVCLVSFLPRVALGNKWNRGPCEPKFESPCPSVCPCPCESECLLLKEERDRASCARVVLDCI